MTGFGIDNVREAFENDMRGLLADSRQALDSLLDGGRFEQWESAADIDMTARLTRALHSVRGTSAAIDVKSMSETAEALEEALERGKAALEAMRSHAPRARSALLECSRGIDALAELLSLELADRRPEASVLASSWRRPGGNGSIKPPKALDVAGVPPELLAIFEEEAVHLFTSIATDVSALEAGGDGPTSMGALERAFHTFKGAAATVGLSHAAEAASVAHRRVERWQTAQVRAADAAPRIRRAAGRVLRACGSEMLKERFGTAFAVGEAASESIATASGSQRSMSPDDGRAELLAVFTEELAEVRGTLEKNFNLWRKAPAELGPPGVLARTLHRLKSAAGVVGDPALGMRAAELQGRLDAIVDAGVVLERAAVDRLVDAANALLKHAGAAPIAIVIVAHEEVDRAAEVFRSEAMALLAEAVALTDNYERGSAGDAPATAVQLGRVFHRLKGSALLGGDARIPDLAAALCRDCEGGRPSAERLRQGVAELSRLVGVPAPALHSADASSQMAVPPTVASLEVDPALWEAFVLEYGETTDAIDELVLRLERSSSPKNELEALMRHVHTLKGAANTVGMSPTGAMLHVVEDVLEDLSQRTGAAVPVGALTRLFVFVQGELRRQLAQVKSGRVSAPVAEVRRRADLLLGARGMADQSAGASAVSGASGAISAATSHDAEHIEEAAPIEASAIRVSIARLDALLSLAGELVGCRSRMSVRLRALESMVRDLGVSRGRLLEVVESFRESHDFSLLREEHARARGRAHGRSNGHGNGHGHAAHSAITKVVDSRFTELELDRYDEVNVLSRRVAELADDVNETGAALYNELGGFVAETNVLGTIVSGVRSEVTQARMVPVGVLFARLRMPVRDAAERESREVTVDTVGESVALDKVVADALFSPLLHLVRNAVVHGIERPEARQRAGKGRAGRLQLRAKEDAGLVLIEIEDDGGGLDLEELRKQGIAHGLLNDRVALDDPAVKEMVFAAGISTRAVAGSVSGRGVGGDIVRRSVQRLNGHIEIRTERGRGTTFRVYLPVSLAISKVLIVRSGELRFALPLHFSERIIARDEVRIADGAATKRLDLDGTLITLRSLREVLDLPPGEAQRSPVVVLRVQDSRIALEVDEVVAQEEVVVKGLGELLSNHEFFAGVTIRGNGELALLFDAAALAGLREERAPSLARVDAPEPQATVAAAIAPAPEPTPLPAPAVPAAPAPAPAPAPAVRKRVLFVDDSLSVRKVAERMLARLDVDVETAVDGVDALEKLRERSYALVFTDLEMPRMNGFDLIREIRFNRELRTMPVVVVTSRTGQKHRDQARSLGANDYLAKPFNPQSLAEVIEMLTRSD